jgi:RAP1 GTPase activating protein 1
MILHFDETFLLNIFRFEAMLKWAKYRVNNKRYSDKTDAKIEFRCCMDRLTRDLKLYRISPQDLIKVFF